MVRLAIARGIEIERQHSCDERPNRDHDLFIFLNIHTAIHIHRHVRTRKMNFPKKKKYITKRSRHANASASRSPRVLLYTCARIMATLVEHCYLICHRTRTKGKNKDEFLSVLRRTNAYHSCKLTICEIKKTANCLC